MTRKRQLRKTQNVFGKKAGQVLVDWLNREGNYQGKKLTSAHRRIEGLLDEWQSLARIPSSHWHAEDWKAFDELQKKLSRYRMSPQIDSKRMGRQGMRFTWNPGPSDEAKAVLVVTWLGERALLWRVRRCGQNDLSTLLTKLDGQKPACCGKWFYAQRKDQRFCGSRLCRQRVYESKRKTPADMAKRAKYMREYRAAQKEQDEASLLSLEAGRTGKAEAKAR